MNHNTYVRTETLISMAINGVLSLVFFLIVFSKVDIVPMWGAGNWVFDFLPQSFMIALMGTLVPGALTAKRLRAGALQPLPQPSRLPHSLALRALVLAVAAALAGTAIVAAIIALAGVTALAWTPALVLKVVYGVVLAAVVTPMGLRSALATR